MSVLTSLGRASADLTVEVKSMLEEALKAMPEQKMAAEELRNGLKNRGVQDIEIKQSGTEDYINNYGDWETKGVLPLSPARVLENISMGRPDQWKVHTIAGNPIYKEKYGPELTSEWQRLTEHTPIETQQALSPEAIDDFLSGIKNAVKDNPDSEFKDMVQNTIIDANKLRDKLVAVDHGIDYPEAWFALNRVFNKGEYLSLTKENVDIMLSKVEQAKADITAELEKASELGKPGLQVALEGFEGAEQNAKNLQFHFKSKWNRELPEYYQNYNEIAFYEGYDDIAEDMTPENIKDLISHLEDKLDDIKASRNYASPTEQAIAERAMLTDIADLEEAAEAIVMRQQAEVGITDEMIADWHSLTDDMGYFELERLTPENVEKYIANIREDLADIDDVYRGEELYLTREAYEDRISQAEDMLGRLRGQAEHTSVGTEPYNLTVTTNELLDQASNEFGRMSSETGITNPNVNNREEVNAFLDAVARTTNEQDAPGLSDLRQSYNTLMDSVEAGEDTITIPNYSTREVGSVKYEFPHEAYRDYTLPDTNDATYAVRIYRNKAVDQKGYEGSHHWADQINDLDDYIFHVRSDSPRTKPDVHRIQEIQSDVQNAMSNAKAGAIRNWSKGTDIDAITPRTIAGRTPAYAENAVADLAKEIRAETNNTLFKEIDYRLNHFDLWSEFDAQEIPLDNVTSTDVLNTLVEFLTEPTSYIDQDIYRLKADAFNPNMQGSKENWLSSNKALMDEFKAAHDMPDDEIDELVRIIEDFDTNYENTAAMVIANRKNRILEAKQLRVTPAERIERIQNHSFDMPNEEKALNKEAFEAASDYLKKEYNIDISGETVTTFRNIRPLVIHRATGKTPLELADLAEKEVRELEKDGHMKYMSAQQWIKFRNSIEDMTDSGVQTLDSLGFFDFDVNKVAQEALDVANQTVKEGLKDLPPLEKFPNADRFNLPVSWAKQGFQEEIVRAIKQGKKEVWLTIDPPGVDKLVRGKRPQEGYEKGGQLYKIFKSTATRFKATVTEEDGYLKMKLPNASNSSNKTAAAAGAAGAGGVITLSAYADTNNQDFVKQAREMGVPEEEIAAYMAENPITEEEVPAWKEQAINEGVSEEEIKQYQHEEFINQLSESDIFEHPGVPSDVPTVEGTVQYDKLPFEEIKQVAIELEVDPSTPMGIDAIYEEVAFRNNPGLRYYKEGLQAEAAESDIADIIELHDYWQPWNYLKASLGSDKAQEVYKENLRKINEDIIKTGEDHGYNLVLGQGQTVGDQELVPDTWYININGAHFEATPGFLASTMREAGEISGGVVGGFAASRLYGSLEAIPPGKMLKYGLITAGITAGAMLGDQVDYAAAAIRQQEEFNWGVAKDKMMGSAQVSVAGEVIGAGIFKIGAAGWKVLNRAYNVMVDGNVDGAYSMLLQTLELTDEQARELVARWETLNHRQAPTMAEKKSRFDPRKYLADPAKEKAIAVLAPARAGGEHIVNTATAMNPQASAAIVTEINQRAKSIQRVVDAQIGPDGIKQLITDVNKGLKRYVDETKDWYSAVKQQGGELAPIGYQWDMDTLAIKELGESLAKTIYKENPRKTFMNMLKRIDDLSETRTFEDLIELRQLVNNMRSKANQGHATYEAYQGIMNNIDEEIASVANRMPEGEQWLSDWENAKASYSEMRRLTTSTLGKAFRRELVSDGTTKGAEQAARWLADFGTTETGTYHQLLKQLPLDVQPKVETLIIDRIISQNMIGDPTGKQAILFPAIARQLSDYKFIWPEAKALQSVVNEFAEIYQNDVILSYVAGGLSRVDAAHFLTDDIVRRAHFALINKVWAQIRIAMGGPKGDSTALSNIASKLLADPLNPHNVEDALKLAKGNIELEAAIKNFSADIAQAEKTGGVITTKIKTYKDKSGKLWSHPGAGRKEAEAIPMHRIATEEVATQVSRAEDLNKLSPAEKARLLNAGYKAIGLEDGTVVVLF